MSLSKKQRFKKKPFILNLPEVLFHRFIRLPWRDPTNSQIIKPGTMLSGLGRRKTSVAKVWLVQSHAKRSFQINEKTYSEYFHQNREHMRNVLSPLTLGLGKKWEVYAYTHGGGLTGQSNAIKLAIARALRRSEYMCHLPKVDHNYHINLKRRKYLVRDSRIKERKKYGLKKARKAPQYSKR